MTKHTFSLAISATSYLPTVLTAIALRVPSFTVEDRRETVGAWLAHFKEMPQDKCAVLLDAVAGATRDPAPHCEAGCSTRHLLAQLG